MLRKALSVAVDWELLSHVPKVRWLKGPQKPVPAASSCLDTRLETVEGVVRGGKNPFQGRHQGGLRAFVRFLQAEMVNIRQPAAYAILVHSSPCCATVL